MALLPLQSVQRGIFPKLKVTDCPCKSLDMYLPSHAVINFCVLIILLTITNVLLHLCLCNLPYSVHLFTCKMLYQNHCHINLTKILMEFFLQFNKLMIQSLNVTSMLMFSMLPVLKSHNYVYEQHFWVSLYVTTRILKLYRFLALRSLLLICFMGRNCGRNNNSRDFLLKTRVGIKFIYFVICLRRHGRNVRVRR